MNFKLIALTILFFSLISCNKTIELKPIHDDIKELVFASGELEWKDAYSLTAQTDGILVKANFEVGNKIQKGTVLATIDNKTNEINSSTAKAQLLIANENLTSNSPQMQQLQQNILIAESKYQQDKIQAERYQRLHENRIGSEVEYENMQLNAKNSLASLNALKKQVLQIQQQAKQQQITAKGQLEDSRIIKDFNKIFVSVSGTVIKKLKTAGDYVRKGDIIAIIANEQKVQAILNVDENSIGKIKLGQAVYVQLNTDKKTVYHGKITEILSAYDENTQSFICKATFDQALKATIFGTQLEANILVGEKKNALLIPRSYMGFGNKVNVKNKDESVIIKTGIISSEYVEVLEGISANDILLPIKP